MPINKRFFFGRISKVSSKGTNEKDVKILGRLLITDRYIFVVAEKYNAEVKTQSEIPKS